MRTRLSVVVFGLAIAALGVSALTVASVVSEAEPRQATLTAASSDDDPGDISGPCDEAEHANDPRCATAPPAPAGRAPAPAPSATQSGNQVLDARGAGTVTYVVRNGVLTVIEAAPAPGWSVEVEQAAGTEIEVDFRAGTQRVQVNVEIEDGQVRERVRVRDDADDSETRFENGVIVRQELGDDHDDFVDVDDRPDDRDDDFDDDREDRVDNSGPGSSTSGPSPDDDPDDDNSGPSHDDDDDNSGPGGHDDDDHEDDDDDSSGPGGGDDD